MDTTTTKDEEVMDDHLVRAVSSAEIICRDSARVAYEMFRGHYRGFPEWEALDDVDRVTWIDVARGAIHNAAPTMTAYFLGEIAGRARENAGNARPNDTLDRAVWTRIANWALQRRRRIIERYGVTDGASSSSFATRYPGNGDLPQM